jgi:hypothetical protein
MPSLTVWHVPSLAGLDVTPRIAPTAVFWIHLFSPTVADRSDSLPLDP